MLAPPRPPAGSSLRVPPGLRWMRLLLPVAGLALFLVVVLAAGLLVVAPFTLGGDPGAGICDAGTSSSSRTSPTAPQTSADLDDTQRRAASTIIGVAKGMAVPPRGWVVALATAMQESRMGLAGMDVAVDHDSLGLFQQRPSQGWGTPAQVRDPVYSTTKFLERLLAVPGWESMPVTRAAQTVQRSAFPGAYAKWEPLASSLVGDLAGVTGAIEECTPAEEAPGLVAALPEGVARTAISFALRESGKPYVWGGTGPRSYDCSGLMLRAYEDAGIVLPRVSREQYRAGQHVPIAQAQPGDLLFWAYDQSDPDTIHHVAMYLGNGRMMEAQQSGVPLGTRAVRFDEDEILPVVTRPGTGTTSSRAVSTTG